MGNILENYKLIILIVPFILIIFIAYLLDLVPKTSSIGKALKFIAEDDLEILIKKNNLKGLNLIKFQIIRVIFTILVSGFIVLIVSAFKSEKSILITSGLISIFVMYKFMYLIILSIEKKRINYLNTMLPYAMKSISYLATVYPVSNALEKSLEVIPKEFHYDIEKLVQDIDDDPTSYKPYQDFVDRYDGKLNRLDFYLKTLYRMSMSATSEEEKLLANLNQIISEEVSIARKYKNQSINKKITNLGLVPVALLTVMLIYMLVLFTEAI